MIHFPDSHSLVTELANQINMTAGQLRIARNGSDRQFQSGRVSGLHSALVLADAADRCRASGHAVQQRSVEEILADLIATAAECEHCGMTDRHDPICVTQRKPAMITDAERASAEAAFEAAFEALR